MIQRTPERDLLPMAQAFELAVTPWSPLAGGVLSGKYQDGNGNGRATSRGLPIPDRSLQIAKVVGEIASEIGKSSSQVALAWLRAQNSSIIPILGVQKLAQLQDNLGCLDLVLSLEQLHRLHEVSQVELGFPHNFLGGEMIRDRLFGGTFASIDNPRQLANRA